MESPVPGRLRGPGDRLPIELQTHLQVGSCERLTSGKIADLAVNSDIT